MSQPKQAKADGLEPANVVTDPNQRRAMANGVWVSIRNGVKIAGTALQRYASLTHNRDASIVGDICVAVAATIERRIR